jgi:hypothetical protein
MVDDVKVFVRRMKSKKVTCGEIVDRGWGILTSVVLPGGSKVSVYEPRHPSPGRAAPAAPAGEKRTKEPSATTRMPRKPKAAASQAAAPKTGPKARKTSAARK